MASSASSPGGDKDLKGSDAVSRDVSYETGVVIYNNQHLQRRMDNRQIQLVAIGGAIGTALFITIGTALVRGGPLNLLMAYTIYSVNMGMINSCVAEMTILHPVEGGFVRMAGKWVDEAFGFMAGWNLFFYEAVNVPFEISALSLVIGYWSDNVPVAAVCGGCIVAYMLLNSLTVRGYGEAEFWLSSGKVILIFMLFFFTFVTMCGGNPKHDAYGFRYWKNPGPFAEYRSTGDLGRFEGFLACFWYAVFTIVGPEYISMASAEVKRPRTYVKTAFKTVYWRFGAFFILGAFFVGTVVSSKDSTLTSIVAGLSGGAGTAAASPYVIAMSNLAISGLPNLVNALICTSVFSAGNTYFFAATRAIYGLSLEGKAPAFLKKTTKAGVPIYCILVTSLTTCLSFLSVSQGTAVVLNWFVNIVTAGSIVNFVGMLITYIFFFRACTAQGLDRRAFPYRGWGQPYVAWFSLVLEVLILFFFGYTSFSPASADSFFSCYTMHIVDVILFIFWKIFKKTKFVKPLEADLVWEKPIVDAYEASITSPPVGVGRELLQMVGFKRNKVDDEQETTA